MNLPHTSSTIATATNIYKHGGLNIVAAKVYCLAVLARAAFVTLEWFPLASALASAMPLYPSEALPVLAFAVLAKFIFPSEPLRVPWLLNRSRVGKVLTHAACHTDSLHSVALLANLFGAILGAILIPSVLLKNYVGAWFGHLSLTMFQCRACWVRPHSG